MSHKNDSPNLTKKSSGLLKDWSSICLSYFFSCLNSIEGHTRLSRLFSGNLLALFFSVRCHFCTRGTKLDARKLLGGQIGGK